MPKIFYNTLKMSLISRLFVFVALWGFTICYFILCFILRNTQIIWRYSHRSKNFSQKRSFLSSNYSKTSSKIRFTLECCLQLFKNLQKHLKSILHFFQYFKKQLKYPLKAVYNSLNKLKSTRIFAKAFKIYLASQLYSIFQVCYRSFLKLNPTL